MMRNIQNNWQYKLIALAIAFTLSMYVNSERHPQSQRTIIVPVRTRNLAKGYAAELDVHRVSITMHGSRQVVDSIRKDDIISLVDLAGVIPKEDVVTEELNIKTHISGVTDAELSYDVNPSSVNVTVEAVGGKRLPVEMKFLASPPLGYAYGNPVISPASVSIMGKSAQVSKVKRIVLTVPDASGGNDIEGDFELTPMASNGTRIKDIDVRPNRVHLKLPLIEAPAMKAIIVSANIIGEPKYPAKVDRVSISPSSITVEGNPLALSKVSTITTDKIDLSDENSTFSKEVKLNLPSGIKLLNKSTVKVTVYIIDSETKTRKSEANNN